MYIKTNQIQKNADRFSTILSLLVADLQENYKFKYIKNYPCMHSLKISSSNTATNRQNWIRSDFLWCE